MDKNYLRRIKFLSEASVRYKIPCLDHNLTQ